MNFNQEVDPVQNRGMNISRITFPVGYYPFHKDRHINFHLNRWYSLGYLPKGDLETLGHGNRDTNDLKQVLIEYAEEMKTEDRYLESAIGYRAAEFFTHPKDEDKLRLYDQFQAAFNHAIKDQEFERILIPYQAGSLPALRFSPEISKGTILVHGGLDSFLEELFTAAYYLFAAGFEVIIFDGPGQGAALRKSNLYMTHRWEEPVSAVLDYFHLDDVTLIGLSLGSYLALRAAAFEKRISRVVAYDVFIYDQHGSGFQGALYKFFLNYPSAYNWVAHTAMRISPAADHLISQWMDILNSSTPADYIAQMQYYSVSDIADRVHQDVLILAGDEDHMIPLKELQKHQEGLVNARSITERIFSADEHAENHCQVGNIKLALDVILDWIIHTT